MEIDPREYFRMEELKRGYVVDRFPGEEGGFLRHCLLCEESIPEGEWCKGCTREAVAAAVLDVIK